MEEFLKVLGFTALPALGNFGGGLLAEVFRISQKTLSLALHAAAGVILAVIGIELMPQALDTTLPWLTLLAFVAGGIFFIFLDGMIDFVQGRLGNTESDSGPWAIFAGVAIDLFSDGLMIGTGSTLSLGLGLLLALGQVSADIPEGFATIAAFKNRGVPRSRRLLLSASFALPLIFGATLGYWVVRDLPEIYKLMLLAFTAGILLTVVIEEMITEAHREKDARFAALFLIGGFALFAMVSVYFG